MAKKKGFLRGLLFEDDGKGTSKPVPKEEAKTEAQPNAPTATAAPATQAPTMVTAATPTGQVDEDIQNQLLQALEEANIDGYDYFEFRGSLENMKAVIPNEPERFKAAYAAVSAMVKPERLIETAQYYIDKLDAKKNEFEALCAQMTEQNVTAKENEAQAIDESIAQKQEQITQLNQQISEVQEQKAALLNEAITEKGKIEKVQVNFNMTHKNVVTRIEQDKTKIQTYLAPKVEEPKEATA